MKSLLKKLFGDSLIYGLSGIISSFISIFLIPLYTKIFSPADYGVISIMTTTSALLSILLIFGMDNSAATWFWSHSSGRQRRNTYTTWMCFTGATGIVVMCLMLLFSRQLSFLFFDSGKYSLLFVLVGINLSIAGFQKVANIWCRMLSKPILAMIYSLVVLLITVGLNIYLLIYLRIGIKGIFISQVIASLSGLIMIVVLFGKWFRVKAFDWGRLTEMLKFSLPLVPAAIIFWVMNIASVYFLKFFVKNDAEVGLYQVGANVANVLSLVTWAFFQAWTPFALSISQRTNARQIYAFIMEGYCALGFFCAFSLLAVSDNLLLIFTNHKYVGAQWVVGLLAINVVLLGIPNILAIANCLTKSNKSYAYATAIGSAITVTLFIFLIPKYGKEGTALAMIVGNLTIPLFLAWRTQKLYHIPYKSGRIMLLIIVEGVAAFVSKELFTGLVLRMCALALIAGVVIIYYYSVYRRSNISSPAIAG